MDIDIFITAYDKSSIDSDNKDLSGLYLVLPRTPIPDRRDKAISTPRLSGEVTPGLYTCKDKNDNILAMYTALFRGALEELELERIFPRPILHIHSDSLLFLELIQTDYTGSNKCIKDVYDKYKALLNKRRKKIEFFSIPRDEILKKLRKYFKWME
jgi:hypothetical protein